MRPQTLQSYRMVIMMMIVVVMMMVVIVIIIIIIIISFSGLLVHFVNSAMKVHSVLNA
jgi:hypothetical protein